MPYLVAFIFNAAYVLNLTQGHETKRDMFAEKFIQHVWAMTWLAIYAKLHEFCYIYSE